MSPWVPLPLSSKRMVMGWLIDDNRCRREVAGINLKERRNV